ncbi:MAG: hypothetical protein J0L73_26410 [Verrucomicrobia bacterium]|nr:hypothetical protein [Verrucomicrobiota bacterium]
MSEATPTPTPQEIAAAEEAATIARYRRYGADLAGCPGWMEHVLSKFTSELNRLSAVIFDPQQVNPQQVEAARQQWFGIDALFKSIRGPVVDAYARSSGPLDEMNGKIPPAILAALTCSTQVVSTPQHQTSPPPVSMPETPSFDPFASASQT